jgi:hypothetical protein
MARTLKLKIYRYDPDKDEAVHARRDRRAEGHRQDAAGRTAAHQVRRRRFAGPAPLVPRRRVRFGRDEHQRQERPGLHHQPERADRAYRAASAARPAGDPRPDRRHDPVLQAVRFDQALPDQRFDPPEKERLQSPKSAKNSTACTSASCARAARPRARRSGGIRTSSSVRPACCKPTVSSPTRATKPPPSAWTTWKIRTACSAATRS